jgi:16S rRNA (guanine966-N2)-methyltransferase
VPGFAAMARRKSIVTIGSGTWRGRVLRYPAGPGVRPSMQRTRTSLFSSLGASLDGAVFADLFAGGGAVGIEALSRGAARAHFVERHADALAALRGNLDACGIGRARASVHAGTVESVLDARPSPIADATIVFADPEYDVDPNAELLRHFRVSAFAGLAWLVVEHRARVVLTPPDGLAVARARRFGETVLTYMTPAQARGHFEGGWS